MEYPERTHTDAGNGTKTRHRKIPGQEWKQSANQDTTASPEAKIAGSQWAAALSAPGSHHCETDHYSKQVSKISKLDKL